MWSRMYVILGGAVWSRDGREWKLRTCIGRRDSQGQSNGVVRDKEENGALYDGDGVKSWFCKAVCWELSRFLCCVCGC